MKFAKERANVICGQLKNAITVQQFPITQWTVKEGCYIDVTQADAAPEEWKKFDAETMRWYGKDRHYWFRTVAQIPEELDGKDVWLHIRTQLEDWDDGRNPQFLVFADGTPIQGLDINHREILLIKNAQKGTKIQLDLQAYTGTLHNEFKLLADLEERDEQIKNLYYDLQVPLWGLNRMDENDRVKWQLEAVINDTINLIDLRRKYSTEFYESIHKAHAYIQKNLYENEELTGFDDVIATCIGHTHIDVAWLWTVAQVRQKCCRSFATVLKLMEEYPNYKFMSSQPQLYEFVKERHPQMYEQIKKRVEEGRWEAEGGMWVEADCNLTSGESLVRQFLFGKRFFQEEFGKDNKVLWLPDVFGYSGALPQIMAKSGIEYFMTTKLAWNQFNKVPMDTFMWEGIDGTKIFTHLITTLGVGQPVNNFFTTYNGMLHPDSIMGGWERYQNKEINNDILVSFGYGDGGGGPTREMLETSLRMEKGIKGIPKVRQEPSRVYFDELYERVKDSKRLPTWVGELYFEYHRGTYTSMGRNKRANRKSEYRMMELEFLSVLAEDKVPYPQEELTAMWKIILRNQFHDILPGSSIHEVYEVTRQEYAQIEAESEALISRRMEEITPKAKGISVLNTLGFDRSDVVNLGDVDAEAVSDGVYVYPTQKTEQGTFAYIRDIPSKGYKGLSVCMAEEKDSRPFTISAQGIETPFYIIEIDAFGQFTSVYDKEAERELLPDGQAGNELRVYEDKPMCFDNWDIDIYYQEKSWPVVEDAKCEWTENGAVRATLKVTKRIMDTVFEQKIHFYANTRRIDFETYVDWKFSQHLCKVHFPVNIHTDEAAFDIQFGNIKRKIHQNTSWDVARFESCAHKWIDMSEGSYGVSLMNDCKYGHSVLDRNMSITLIKSGTDPNETADQEEHYFTYSLYPHMGTWKEADTVKESFCLNVPTRILQGGTASNHYSYMKCDNRNVVLETIKAAENNDGVIVRLYEVENSRGTVHVTTAQSIESIEEVDLLEHDIVPGSKADTETTGTACVQNGGKGFTFKILPYEIKTFRIRFAH